MSTSAEVWCVTPSSSRGWGPITALAELTARMWDTTPRFLHPDKPYGPIRKLASLAPRRRSGDRALLLIAAHPGDLLSLARPQVLAGRFEQVGAWIIDSFWDDLTPRFARTRHTLDHLWITDAELTDSYSRATGIPTGWLPWGTDSLAITRRSPADRDIDVLRLGRQPAAWDDDTINTETFAAAGLRYAGRFADPGDGLANQEEVIARLCRAKLVLASGSLASGSSYTHPTREYISGRFTDAVACGTPIAGARPRCAAADLLPSQAWVDIEVSSREAGLPAIIEAVQTYDESLGASLQRAARERLDWRHRIAVISEAFGVRSDRLTADLEALGAAGQ